MLVLTRKPGERIRIGDAVEITVLRIQGGRVSIGFSADHTVPIARDNAKKVGSQPGKEL